MSFKLTGSIKFIGQPVQVSEKFRKLEFVVTDTTTMYPQDIAFQLAQDKVDLIIPFMEGQDVEVSFNLRGKEWISPTGEARYFNTLEAWRIDSAGSVANTSTTQPATTEIATPTSGAEDGDLPF